MRLRVPDIDFTKRRLTSTLGMALLAVGCLFVAAAVGVDASQGDELQHLNDELGHAKKSLQRAELRAKGNAGGIVEANIPADWPSRLQTPWSELFQSLERAQTDSIALLSIEPDADRQRLRLGGEAKDAAVLIAYLKGLEASEQIDDLRILMQQVKQDDPQHPLEFLVEVRWNNGRSQASIARKSS